MGNESENKPKLTMNDPVDPATLKRIGDIQTRRFQLGDMMLDLEQEKVKILVESRKLDDERQRLFAGILAARGLTPNVPVEIDSETGKINLIKTNGRVEPQAPPPEPPSEMGNTTPAPPPV